MKRFVLMTKVSRVALLLTLLGTLLSCSSTQIIRKTTFSLEVKEVNGIKSYKNGDFEAAFNYLKEPAAWGYKGSQYAIAFMFLKGQHVQQSTLLGMGWLGVATEANVQEWSEQYATFYAAASAEEQAEFDRLRALYIERFGLAAQNVTCTKSQSTTTRRVNVSCHKYGGLGILYDIDLVE